MPELSSVDTPRRTEGEWDICCLEHGIQPSAVDDSFLFVSGIAVKTPRPILLEPINPPYVNSLASLPWPLYSTSSSVSVLPITSSSHWLGSSYPIKSMLISEAEEWLPVLGELPWTRGLGEISTELSNLCTELQSITSSSSVDFWKPPWALYYSSLPIKGSMSCKNTITP